MVVSGKIAYKRIVLHLVVLFCSIMHLQAQSIKELTDKLQTASTQEKPIILNLLSEAYFKTNLDKSISYGEQALRISRKIGDTDAEIEALSNIGDAYIAQKNQKRGIAYYKDIIEIYGRDQQTRNAAYVWNKIAKSYYDAQKYDDAADATKEALALFKTANDRTGIVNANIYLGDIYYIQRNYESALPYYRQALKLYEETRDSRGQVNILTRIANTYINQKSYDEAYTILTRALDVAKKSHLTAQANKITQSLENVKRDLSAWKKKQLEDESQKEMVTKQKDLAQQAAIRLKEVEIKKSQSQITTLAEEQTKSMEEIERMGIDAQIKELKIRTQQEELIRKQMETEAQERTNTLLKRENQLREAELQRQQLIIWGVIVFSALGVVFTVFVFFAYRNKRKANKSLMQKNEIIYKQKAQIELKNVQITDSIDYARNIQEAILPPSGKLSSYFTDSFIYYKPKDIVSGDFYWTHEEKDKCFCVAAADCTGHGVPGAFMSLLGFIMLEDSVKSNPDSTPAEVLKEVNTSLMNTLHQDGQDTTGKFGMDIAFVKYNIEKKVISFSGAFNPLIVISDGKITEIKADKNSIGTTMECAFTDHSIQLKQGDYVYIYSDGYQDQIGGEKRKKFLSYNFKELLLQISPLSSYEQMEKLEQKHNEWRMDIDQIDDILIIGFKI